MAFALGVSAESDGAVSVTADSLHITDATETVLYFVTETGFKGYAAMPSTDTAATAKACVSRLSAFVEQIAYEDLKAEHVADYRALYKKSSLYLTATALPAETSATTDALLSAVKKGGNLQPLAELLYNYGKYLTIAGSRPGGQALTLQGLWNHKVRPPWSSNYTLNINTQMNYWGASSAGLDECLLPLLQMTKDLMVTGAKTASINYGCGGFAVNHNTDLWRKSDPVKGTPNYMLEPLCGAWLVNELCAHYRNGALQDYKEDITELAEASARFCTDYLVLYKGEYVVCPSSSPEQQFLNDDGTCSLDFASAFDQSVVREALQNALHFSADEALRAKAQERLRRLAPVTMNREKGLNEWHKQRTLKDTGHRHFSPLYGLFPAAQIGYYRDPALRSAARTLFEERLRNAGRGTVGWSAVWALCLAGRFRDAATAERQLRRFFTGALFRNLFGKHPPNYFQIDANLGFLAALPGLLVTEDDGILELLPALPAGWTGGSVQRLRIGGVEVSFSFEDGKVVTLSASAPVRVRRTEAVKACREGENITFTDGA